MNKGILLAVLFVFAYCNVFSQDEELDVKPGKDRWNIKTSVAQHKKPKHVKLSDLLQLPLLDAQYSTNAYDNKLVPEKQDGNIKEGDIITTEGYLRLVALEKSAG